MNEYAQQCASNLQQWELRCAELTAQAEAGTGVVGDDDRKVMSPSAMLGRPEDYMTAFPLTLPSACLLLQEHATPVTWKMYSRSEGSSSSSDVSSDSQSSGMAGHHDMNRTAGTPIYSPLSDPGSPAESMGSFMFSPRSELGGGAGGLPFRPPSGSENGGGGGGGGTSAIRAAYEVSGRKKKRCNRNSWNPSVASVSAAAVAATATAAVAVAANATTHHRASVGTTSGCAGEGERVALLVVPASVAATATPRID